MHEPGRSDDPVVPAKPPNKAAAAEVVEERGSAKGNTDGAARPGRSAGQGVSHELDRVREAARKDRTARFTALLHHVDADRLQAAYRALNPGAAAGVDGVTWAAYGEDLDSNVQNLLTRLHRGSYRAQPSRRAYIPKADGRPRPLGIASLEDKIVQRAVVEVLDAIYETDFLGFSYGCRLASCIPIRKCASTPEPEAGAQCVSSARWDLCGGPLVESGPYRDQFRSVASL